MGMLFVRFWLSWDGVSRLEAQRCPLDTPDFLHPIRRRAAKTRRAFVDGHRLMVIPQRGRLSGEQACCGPDDPQGRARKELALVRLLPGGFVCKSTRRGKSGTSANQQPSSSCSTSIVNGSTIHLPFILTRKGVETAQRSNPGNSGCWPCLPNSSTTVVAKVT